MCVKKKKKRGKYALNDFIFYLFDENEEDVKIFTNNITIVPTCQFISLENCIKNNKFCFKLSIIVRSNLFDGVMILETIKN